jgi:hypothetical protein
VVSLIFQDLSYDMMSKNFYFNLKFLLVKKRVVGQIHTCEFGCPNCPFFCKLCFWSENSFQKKSGGQGESEKINKKGGKGIKKGGGAELWHNYEGLVPPWS